MILKLFIKDYDVDSLKVGMVNPNFYSQQYQLPNGAVHRQEDVLQVIVGIEERLKNVHFTWENLNVRMEKKYFFKKSNSNESNKNIINNGRKKKFFLLSLFKIIVLK